MDADKLLLILNNLCNHLVKTDADVEVMDTLIDCGANLSDLRTIGFDEDQIDDYIYYVSIMENISEDEARTNLENLD